MLPLDERHARSRVEMDVDDPVGIRPPAHVAGEDAAIGVNMLYYRDMTRSVGPLHPRLQDYDGARAGLRGNAPPELVRTGRPLPGIRLCAPRDIYSMQFMVALIGPPGTPGVGEPVIGAGGRPMGLRRSVRGMGNVHLRMGSF